MAYLRIEAADNGFILRYDDPDLIAKNRESDDYVDPERTTVFPDKASVQAALPAILDKVAQAELDEAAARAGDFAGAFAETASED